MRDVGGIAAAAHALWRHCRIKMFVLDEADEMLSRGFKDQIYDIFQLMPPNLQVGGAPPGGHTCSSELHSLSCHRSHPVC